MQDAGCCARICVHADLCKSNHRDVVCKLPHVDLCGLPAVHDDDYRCQFLHKPMVQPCVYGPCSQTIAWERDIHAIQCESAYARAAGGGEFCVVKDAYGLARVQELFDLPQTVTGVEQASEALVPFFEQEIRVI